MLEFRLNEIAAHLPELINKLQDGESISITRHNSSVAVDMPGDARTPNAVTLQTFRDTDAGIGVIPCNNLDDLFRKAGLDD